MVLGQTDRAGCASAVALPGERLGVALYDDLTPAPMWWRTSTA